MAEWQALTRLTGGGAFEVERVRLSTDGVAIEGRFELPPLARLSAEDQVFVAAFVRSHGSIKEMEQLFGISYPTVKNRLNQIAARLPLGETVTGAEPQSTAELLNKLGRGELSVDQVLEHLGRRKQEKEKQR